MSYLGLANPGASIQPVLNAAEQESAGGSPFDIKFQLECSQVTEECGLSGRTVTHEMTHGEIELICENCGVRWSGSVLFHVVLLSVLPSRTSFFNCPIQKGDRSITCL